MYSLFIRDGINSDIIYSIGLFLPDNDLINFSLATKFTHKSLQELLLKRKLEDLTDLELSSKNKDFVIKNILLKRSLNNIKIFYDSSGNKIWTKNNEPYRKIGKDIGNLNDKEWIEKIFKNYYGYTSLSIKGTIFNNFYGFAHSVINGYYIWYKKYTGPGYICDYTKKSFNIFYDKVLNFRYEDVSEKYRIEMRKKYISSDTRRKLFIFP